MVTVNAAAERIMSNLIHRMSEEDRDFHERKNAAAEFFRMNRVPEEIERALNHLFVHEPPDLHGFLANYFTDLSAPPRVSRLNGREVYDARGQLSVEAEVFCIICNEEKSTSCAAISSLLEPLGASLDEEVKSSDRAEHVATAVRWINEPLSQMLKNLDPCDQQEVDRILRDFFVARELEEKQNAERKLEEQPPPSEPEEVPPPLPAPTKVKKNADKVKQKKSLDKRSQDVAPPEPPEPVLPGSLAIGSVSLALARTGSQLRGTPLYKYIGALKNPAAQLQFHNPVPLVTLLSCGKSSLGKLNLLEEIIAIPAAGQGVRQTITMTLEIKEELMRIMNETTKGGVASAFLSDSGAPTGSYDRPEQPLELIAEACANLGLTLGAELHLALNCAAPELMDYSKGKYEIATGAFKSADELVDTYQTLVSKHPAVVVLIDPLRREDTEQWEKLTGAIGASCSLLCDVTHKHHAPPLPGVKGHIIKHVNEMTVSDLIRSASQQQGLLLMGAAGSESCSDDSLSDIAVGLSADYVKLGGLSGAERMNKYNRLISIEEELERQGITGSRTSPPPLFPDKPQEPPEEVQPPDPV